MLRTAAYVQSRTAARGRNTGKCAVLDPASLGAAPPFGGHLAPEIARQLAAQEAQHVLVGTQAGGGILEQVALAPLHGLSALEHHIRGVFRLVGDAVVAAEAQTLDERQMRVDLTGQCLEHLRPAAADEALAEGLGARKILGSR